MPLNSRDPAVKTLGGYYPLELGEKWTEQGVSGGYRRIKGEELPSNSGEELKDDDPATLRA